MIVVILGMHRSGTSLASGLLELAGVHFGEESEMIPANDENPKGFRERRDIRVLNDRLLHAQGCDWNEVSGLDPDRIDRDLLASACEEAEGIVSTALAQSGTGVLGLKEPRMCLLMPFWAGVLPGDVLHVLVHRDPEEIAISLATRNRMPAAIANYLTETYLGHALAFVGSRPTVLVRYRDMLEDPAGVTRRILAEMGPAGHRLPEPDEQMLREFATSDLYRSRPRQEPYAMSRRLQTWCERLDRGELPRVTSGHVKATAEVLAYEHDHRFAEFTRIRTELGHQRHRVSTLEAQVVSNREFDQQVKSLRAELTRSREEASEQRRNRKQVQSDLDSARLELRETKATAERLGKELETTQELSSRLREERDLSRRELATSRNELESARAALASAQSALASTQSVLATAQSELESTRAELANAISGLSTTRAELAETRRAVLLTAGQLESARNRQQAQARLLESRDRQIEAQRKLLELTDRLTHTLSRLHSSASWKVLRPLLAGMLGARPGGKRSTALSDIARFMDEYSTGRAVLRSTPVLPEAAGPDGRSVPAAARLPGTALVITWDVGHNPLGRSYMLAEVLERVFRNVVIVGFQFQRYGDETWEPLRHGRIPVISLPGGDLPEFLGALESIAARIDPDIVFACKSRLPSLLLGVLIKRRLGCPLVCDIDDHELAFFQGQEEISMDMLAAMPEGSAREHVEPFDGFWTGVAQGARHLADALLVSNQALERAFGGTVVPHVRDETVFDPAIHNRELNRVEFGIPLDAKVVLFFGTPRRHKGIEHIARAVAAVDDPRTLLLVVGDAPDKRDLARVSEQAGGRVRMLGNQPFSRIPDILSLADAVCLPQDPTHPVSAWQLPAKAIDALAMGVPLLVFPTEPLKRLVDLGLALAITEEGMAQTLTDVLAGNDGTGWGDAARRQAFIEHFSHAAAAGTLRELSARLLGIAAAGRKDEHWLEQCDRFLLAQRRALGVDAGPAKSDEPMPGHDFVLFWKQNDTGLYGRRVDMFIEYLAQRDDVRKVVVFDAPISEFDLGRLRDGSGRPSQDRWVHVRTYEKMLGKFDSPQVSYNVFVHPPGIYDLPGRVSPGRRPLAEGYLPFIERVLEREGVVAQDAIFVFYPKNLLGNTIIDRFAPRRVLVDVVDDQREWPGISGEERDQISRNYEELLARADLAFVNCQPMYEKMAPFTDRLRLVENGCDSNLSMQEPKTSPAFRKLLEWTGPVIGFVGNLEAKIDMDLVEKTARRFPASLVLLIGSTHANQRVGELDRLSNVMMPGVVPYREIGAWLAHFDVAIVPHLRTGMTDSMNPLKVFVYLQHGVPVVSTDVANIGYRGPLLRIGASHAEFLDHVASLLEQPPANREQERQRFVKDNDWKARFDAPINSLLEPGHT